MKITSILSFVIFLSLASCQYSQQQKDMIQKIASSDKDRFENQFRSDLFKEFSKKDMINLSSHENPKIALYFFNILMEKYPQECFQVLMKNLDNTKTSDIWTSYDTINEMTVPQAMIFYTMYKGNILTEIQKEKLFEAIIMDIDNKRHLYGDLFSYLGEHQNNPNPKYYNILKKEMNRKENILFYANTYLLNYFANYNRPEDSLIIKNYLEKNIDDNGPIHMNMSVEFINKHPKPSYLPILEEFYSRRIKGKEFTADPGFFELEDLTLATLKYNTESSKNLLKNITYHTQYKPDEELAANEQLYFFINTYDRSNYFADIKNDLKSKLNKTKMDSVISKHERWDRYKK